MTTVRILGALAYGRRPVQSFQRRYGTRIRSVRHRRRLLRDAVSGERQKR